MKTSMYGGYAPDEDLVSFVYDDTAWGFSNIRLDFLGIGRDLDEFLPEFPTMEVAMPVVVKPKCGDPLKMKLSSGNMLVLAIIGFTIINYILVYFMNIWPRLGIPSPTFYTILGNVLEIQQLGGFRSALRTWFYEYGKIFGFHLGRQQVLVVAEAYIAQLILENENKAFNDKYNVPWTLRTELSSKCIFLSHGYKYENQHSNMSTVFCPENYSIMIARINRSARKMAESMEDATADNILLENFNLRELLSSFSYDTLAAMILGLELDHYTRPNEDEFFKVLHIVFRSCCWEYEGVSVPTKTRKLVKYFEEKLNERKRCPKDEGMVDFLDLFIHTVPPGPSGSGSSRDLSMSGYTLSVTEMAGNLAFWVLHSHETIISAMMFLFHVLSNFPDHQHIIMAEVETNIPDEYPDYNDLNNLPFLDLVIKETLRLFSPVQEIWRYSNKQAEIENYIIPAHTAIMIPMYLIHQDEDYFFEPDQFEPERYFAGESPHMRSDVFLSFGAGMEMCMGWELVLLQIKACMVQISRRVWIKPHRDQEKITAQVCGEHMHQAQSAIIVTDEGLLRPLKDLQIDIEPRRPHDVYQLQPVELWKSIAESPQDFFDNSGPPQKVSKEDRKKKAADSVVHYARQKANRQTLPPARVWGQAGPAAPMQQVLGIQGPKTIQSKHQGKDDATPGVYHVYHHVFLENEEQEEQSGMYEPQKYNRYGEPIMTTPPLPPGKDFSGKKKKHRRRESILAEFDDDRQISRSYERDSRGSFSIMDMRAAGIVDEVTESIYNLMEKSETEYDENGDPIVKENPGIWATLQNIMSQMGEDEKENRVKVVEKPKDGDGSGSDKGPSGDEPPEGGAEKKKTPPGGASPAGSVDSKGKKKDKKGKKGSPSGSGTATSGEEGGKKKSKKDKKGKKGSPSASGGSAGSGGKKKGKKDKKGKGGSPSGSGTASGAESGDGKKKGKKGEADGKDGKKKDKKKDKGGDTPGASGDEGGKKGKKDKDKKGKKGKGDSPTASGGETPGGDKKKDKKGKKGKGGSPSGSGGETPGGDKKDKKGKKGKGGSPSGSGGETPGGDKKDKKGKKGSKGKKDGSPSGSGDEKKKKKDKGKKSPPDSGAASPGGSDDKKKKKKDKGDKGSPGGSGDDKKKKKKDKGDKGSPGGSGDDKKKKKKDKGDKGSPGGSGDEKKKKKKDKGDKGGSSGDEKKKKKKK